MAEVWTKEQYINWLETRPDDPAYWKYEDCKNADAHIKKKTLRSLKWLLSNIRLPWQVKDWVILMADLHFGSAETDEMLTRLNCYPTYMNRS